MRESYPGVPNEVLQPKQRDLFTRRFRTVPARSVSEAQFQIQFVTELQLILRKGVTMWATINEEVDERRRSKNSAMGLLAGASDLNFRWGPPVQLLHLELKARGRTPTDDQLFFGVRAKADGAFYEWCDNIQDAVAIVAKYGLLK